MSVKMAANASLNTSGTVMPSGWMEAGFPSTVQEMEQSQQFVKRLVAIGFSQILYLRTDLPEDCYKPHPIADIDLRMLKGKSRSEAANKLTQSLKNAMAAFDLGYLRQLVIVIMENKKKPEEAYETYTFNFNKPNNIGNKSGNSGFSLVQSARKGNKLHNMQGKSNEEMVSKNIMEIENLIDGNPENPSTSDNAKTYKIYNATKKLLRKLIVAMQGLNPIPERAYMTVQIGYYDDITPNSYQPRGFCAIASGSRFVDTNVGALSMGEVKSAFHQVEVSLRSRAFDDGNKSIEEEILHAQESAEDENLKAKHNESFVSLNPGLDVTLNQSHPKDASVLSHGSNVEECDTRNIHEQGTANVLKNIQNINQGKVNVTEKGKGKKSKASKNLPESYRPSAHGDSQFVRPSHQNDQKMKQGAGDTCMEVDQSPNTTRSSVGNERSIRPVRKMSSRRDTFSDDVFYEENFHAKASVAKKFVRI